MKRYIVLPRSLRKLLVLFSVSVLTCSLLTACAARSVAKRPSARLIGVVRLADGQPVKGGTIRLHFKDHGTATGTINPNGSFVFANLPAATAQVAIETASVKKAQQGPKTSFLDPNVAKVMESKKEIAPLLKEMPGKADKVEYVPLPPRYAAFDRSGLTIELMVGQNHRDFTIPKE